ncbi:hypothetical protein M8C21_013304 [Ambrosia artemisiifolia]|uniref:cyclin-dependent kinase n=1 Tax=Ambrosia artemisiifolia TaxID=4212 RepID=A0AAD5BZL0_AMBAR|nr:hypothetical protein M8C21_013304 [Ambrosia artemisiifolia]
MLSNYDIVKKIGEGVYGNVYKAWDKTGKRHVAIKKTKIEKGEQGIPPTALREVGMLNLLSSSTYIVSLLDVEHGIDAKGNPSLCLVFEFLDSDLKTFIANHPSPLSDSLVKRFLFQLCIGLSHCHGIGVLHRDLKPANLLVNEDKMVLKIADLGLGRPLAIPLKRFTPETVTPNYRAPELTLGDKAYYTGIDIWSLGCVFAEMCKGRPLFPYRSGNQHLELIFSLLGTPTEEDWPGVTSLRLWNTDFQFIQRRNLADAVPSLGADGLDLLSKMLTCNPAKRISARAAMDHPYFASLDRSEF